MDSEIIILFAGWFYLGLGIWGVWLAFKTLTAAAGDRAVARALQRDSSLDIAANKMVRLSYNRIVVASFGILTGIFALLPRPADAPACDDGLSAIGVLFLLSIAVILAMQIWVSMMDLDDRARLLNGEVTNV